MELCAGAEARETLHSADGVAVEVEDPQGGEGRPELAGRKTLNLGRKGMKQY